MQYSDLDEFLWQFDWLRLHQQIDGVSMGISFGPLLANIIMTELERKVIKQFIDDKTLMFYGRYVDDTLVVINLKI